MSKYCTNFGKKLNENTGLCPVCDEQGDFVQKPGKNKEKQTGLYLIIAGAISIFYLLFIFGGNIWAAQVFSSVFGVGGSIALILGFIMYNQVKLFGVD